MGTSYEKQHYLNVLKHRGHVRHVINVITHDLQTRAQCHDKSSTELEQEEINVKLLKMDMSEDRLGQTERYTSETRLIDIHNKNEEHHLEYYGSDITKMDAVQLITFIADQYAEYQVEMPNREISFREYVIIKHTYLRWSEDIESLIINTARYIEENA